MFTVLKLLPSLLHLLVLSTFLFFYFDEKSVMSVVFCNVIMVLLLYVHVCV